MFTSILSSIIIWSAVLIIALRVVTNSGIQFSNNKYISELDLLQRYFIKL